MKRPICAIALAAALISALTVTGAAPADPVGGPAATIAKKCKKKKGAGAAKKCKKKQQAKAPTTVSASIRSGVPAAANYNGIEGFVSSPAEFCPILRDVQVINVANGVPIGFGKTGDPNTSFSITIIPRQPAGTLMQVVVPENAVCLEGRSVVLAAPAGAT